MYTIWKMTRLFLSCIVLLLNTLAFGQEYSFCAENNLFSFSRKSCPGGVLLKEAIKIDEPCYCFGADLTIYEDCESGNGVLKAGTSPGCQAPLIQRSDKWSGKAKFFLPSENITKTTGDVEFCPKIRNSCVRLGAAAGRSLDPVMNDINSDSLFDQQRISRQGGSDHVCTIFETNCTDSYTAKINSAIRVLSYAQNPHQLLVVSNVFNLMKLSVEVFKMLSPEFIIPHSTLDTIFNNFQLNYLRLDAITADRHMREETYLPIKWKLEQCLQDIKNEAESSSNNTSQLFVRDTSVCPPVVSQSAQASSGESMPVDRKYIPEQEDLIIGAMWKIMDTVHTKCLFYNVYYFTTIEDIFLEPEVHEKHYNGNGHGTSNYAGLINQDDLPGFMENLDRVNAAIHSAAKFKGYFKKPRRPAATSSRKKRSVTDDSIVEIWGGRAYCLLRQHNISTFNEHPELKQVCSKKLSLLEFQCNPYELKNALGRNVSLDCPQEGSGFKSGIYRVENGQVESCCYKSIKCSIENKEKCLEDCKQFCAKMKAQHFSEKENHEFCTCKHSAEFMKLVMHS